MSEFIIEANGTFSFGKGFSHFQGFLNANNHPEREFIKPN